MTHVDAGVPGNGDLQEVWVSCGEDAPNSEQVLGAFASVIDYPDGPGTPGVVRPEAPAGSVPVPDQQAGQSRGIPIVEFYVRAAENGLTSLSVWLVCARIVNGNPSF
jgi:hypothetical protein